MTNSAPEPETLLPLPPATFHIMMVLARGENHGYGIMLAVTESTNGQFRLGPGTLYSTIKRLLQAAWIEECEERPDPELDDERRRYYRLTDLGERVARAEAVRLAEMVQLAHESQLLGGAAFSGG